MAKIKQLSSDVANQIAAGEVVERPASVVKELVENALDAGAKRVTVELTQAGFSRIRVTDDGEGMDAEDATLAVLRHATSKIARIEELEAIRTFGFRGEALPSIASVSKVTLTTRRQSDAEGTLVRVDGGGEPVVRPAGCAVGTSVEVCELFFNVPARRKFLKAQNTEAAHVSEVVLMAALARPDVTFVLTRDGRVAREYLRAASRKERVAQALPGEALEACAVESRGDITIEAHLGPPERARAGAVGLHLLVNGRPVRDRALARAVAQAYGSVLEPGRYPIGAVYIDLRPELVDVNVHPQKAEVRFADARALFDRITRELHGSLAGAFVLPSLGSPAWRRPPSSATFDAPTSPSFEPARDPWGLAGASQAPSPSSMGPDTMKSLAENVATARDLFAGPGFYARLTFLAQLRATFLLCEGDDALYVLDQHAAAERVTFDRLRRAYATRQIASQRLLVPEVIELTPAEVIALEEAIASIAPLGVDLRAVSSTAIAVHAVPQILKRSSPERIVRDLLAELGHAARRPFSDAADLVLATMACHGSIRAGDAIAADEARALLRALDEVDFAGHCPHGRPVVTRVTYDELERRVGR